jgi:hypothetical protein
MFGFEDPKKWNEALTRGAYMAASHPLFYLPHVTAPHATRIARISLACAGPLLLHRGRNSSSAPPLRLQLLLYDPLLLLCLDLPVAPPYGSSARLRLTYTPRPAALILPRLARRPC